MEEEKIYIYGTHLIKEKEKDGKKIYSSKEIFDSDVREEILYGRGKEFEDESLDEFKKRLLNLK